MLQQVAAKMLQSRYARTDFAKFCINESVHETFPYFFFRFAYVRMPFCTSMFSRFFDKLEVPEAPGGTPGGFSAPFWHPRRLQRPSGNKFSSILGVILGPLGEPGEPLWTTWGTSGTLFSHVWRNFFEVSSEIAFLHLLDPNIFEKSYLLECADVAFVLYHE